jgi:FkbH-like protein
MWEHNGRFGALGALRTLPANHKKFLPLIWEEHCTECAVPECYKSCILYDQRPDGACRRFTEGISLNSSLSGSSSKIQFKRWGKLESPIGGRELNSSLYPYLEFLNNLAWLVASKLTFWTKNPKYQQALSWRRRKWVESNKPNQIHTDRVFLVEILDASNECVLVVEIANSERVFFSSGLKIPQGKSVHQVLIPKAIFSNPNLLIRIIPSGDEGVEIAFGLVELLEDPSIARSLLDKPAEFVKCVVWDLDNTLWWGVISEDKDSIQVRNEVVDAIMTLDSRGILNSISSKNDEGEVMPKLKELGILDYFLVPKINWNPKSANIKEIAATLNINLDTFLFIDDSEFELAEVANSLRQVRTKNSFNLENLLNEPFLNPKISSESRSRREMYQVDLIRNQIALESGLDYHNFLLESELELFVSAIHSKEDLHRSFELLSRTNQLNISGTRYSFEEFNVIANDASSIWYTGQVKDKYGNYGQVLVSRVRVNPNFLLIEELAISCRVAERRIEDSFFQCLREQDFGFKKALILKFTESGKNHRMKESIQRIGFQRTESGDLILSPEVKVADSSIVKSFFQT